MEKRCGTCLKQYVNCGFMSTQNNWLCWQPKDEPMEERLNAIVARVRAIYPDKYIRVRQEARQHDGRDTDYEIRLYLEYENPSWLDFPTTKALNSYVTDLEEKHRKDRMTDIEKIREFAVSECRSREQELITDFIDVLTGELPF